MVKKANSESLSEEKATKKISKKRVVADAGEEKKTMKKASRKKIVTGDGDAKPVKKITRSRTKSTSGEATSSVPVMKAFWGVFNPMMVQVAQYEYFQEKEAQLAATELTEKKKTPHFVQIIKKLV